MGSEIQEFGFMNSVVHVDWPLYEDGEADIKFKRQLVVRVR